MGTVSRIYLCIINWAQGNWATKTKPNHPTIHITIFKDEVDGDGEYCPCPRTFALARDFCRHGIGDR